MFRIMVILMVVIPALEIWVLILMGQWIGAWPTFLLILLTGFAGAFLAKSEAKKVWHYAKYELSAGSVPGMSILDGICIFAGGLLLLTPGFITDTLGFLLLIPPTRKIFRHVLLHLIRKYISEGKIIFFRR